MCKYKQTYLNGYRNIEWSQVFIHTLNVLLLIYYSCIYLLIDDKDTLFYSYSRNDCILAIYYELNIYDFMHVINSFTIIMPTKTVTWMSAIYEI